MLAHKQPLFTALVLLVFSFLLDFSVLGVYAQDTINASSGNKYADTNKFCLAYAPPPPAARSFLAG